MWRERGREGGRRGDGVMGQRERGRDGWSESDRGEREGGRIKMEME